jgi:hypothetical protein
MNLEVLLILLFCFLFSVIPGLFVLRYVRQRGPGLKTLLLAAAQEKNLEHPSRSFPVKNAVGSASRLGLITTILLISGLGMMAAGVYFQANEIERAELLKNEGIKTTAIVTATHHNSDSEGDDTYTISYTFTSTAADRSSQQTSTLEDVNEDLYYATEKGQKIAIIYAPSRPDVSRILAQYQPGAINWLALALGGGLGLVDLLISAGFFVQWRKARRLDEEGQIVSVKVIDLYSDSDSESTSYYVAYQLPGTQPFRHSVSGKVYKSLEVGSHITVRYIPGNPGVFRIE